VSSVELNEEELEMVAGGRLNELRQMIATRPMIKVMKDKYESPPVVIQPPNTGDGPEISAATR